MRKLRTVLLILIGIGILVAAAFFIIGALKKENAGLLIESTPTSSVYIASEQVGRTPYESNLNPGEVVIKLVPDAIDKALAPYETKVTLSSGIKTVIRREFGETEDTSAGDIISFEKVGGKEVSISVVTIPNSAQISIDGQIRGFAPYKTSSITPGEHSLIVSSQGYIDRTITLKGVAGYRLTAVIKLKPSEEGAPPQALGESKKEDKKVMVEILSTPTGFLRVRKSASSSSEELTQVKPGQRFPFLDEDTEANWYKIEYLPAQAGQPARVGWVTGQYAKKVEVDASISLTPTPTPKITATPSATPTKKITPTATPKPLTPTP